MLEFCSLVVLPVWKVYKLALVTLQLELMNCSINYTWPTVFPTFANARKKVALNICVLRCGPERGLIRMGNWHWKFENSRTIYFSSIKYGGTHLDFLAHCREVYYFAPFIEGINFIYVFCFIITIQNNTVWINWSWDELDLNPNLRLHLISNWQWKGNIGDGTQKLLPLHRYSNPEMNKH